MISVKEPLEANIFAINENLRGLKKDFANLKLEYDYLSSAEKLLELQNSYFDAELSKKNIEVDVFFSSKHGLDSKIKDKGFNKKFNWPSKNNFPSFRTYCK